MKIVELILVVILIVMVALLVSPLFIEGDSRIPALTFRWRGWVTFRMAYGEDGTYFQLKILFIERRWRWRPSVAQKEKPPAKKPKKKRPGLSFRKVIRLIKTFEVLQFYLAIDTSDTVVNARLYPLNFIGYPTGTSVHINFLNENCLVFRLKNRPWRILWAWVRSDDHS